MSPRFVGYRVGLWVVLAVSIIGCSDAAQPSATPNAATSSTYPTDTPPAFAIPTPAPDAAQQAATADALVGSWATAGTSNPNASGIRFGVVADPTLGVSESAQLGTAVWLKAGQPFVADMTLQAFLPPTEMDGDFVVKAFTDFRESAISADGGSPMPTLRFTVARGEVRRLRLSLGALPDGAHVLHWILLRPHAESDASLYRPQANGGILASTFRVYVGSTAAAPPSLQPWPGAPTTLSGLANSVSIVPPNTSLSDQSGIPAWTPAPVPAGTRVPFDVVLNNPGSTDREYCVVALLDGSQTALDGDKEGACGIVRGGQMATLHTGIVAPPSAGAHNLSIVRFENPMLKTTYATTNRDSIARQVIGTNPVTLHIGS